MPVCCRAAFVAVSCGPTGVAGAACVAPLVFRAPEAPAAREARRPHFVRPAPRSTPVPSGPSGALHTSGAGLLCVPMGCGPPASQAARLSETGVAFAGAGRASTETAIAFAGAKWAFLVQFSGAEVMPVSEVPCWGRAVVLVVSTSPRCLASCAKNFALLGLMCARARKSSPCALTMAQNWRFLACWASFFAEEPLEGRCWASFFAPTDPVPVLDAAPCTSGWLPMGDLQH